MFTRAILLATLIANLASAPIAHAQTQPPIAATQAVSPESLDAARAFYRATILEGGALESLVAALAPTFAANIQSSPLYQTSSAPQRAALDAFTATLPDILVTAFRSELELRTDCAAPRLAGVLTTDELMGATAFLRSPDMQILWRQLAQRVAETSGHSESGAFPDWSATEAGRAFAQTDSGRALIEHEDQIDVILTDQTADVVAQIRPLLQTRIAIGLCEVLADRCPANLRERAHTP